MGFFFYYVYNLIINQYMPQSGTKFSFIITISFVKDSTDF